MGRLFFRFMKEKKSADFSGGRAFQAEGHFEQKFAEQFACTKDPLVKGGRIAYKAIRGDSCRQYEFAENLAK